MNYSKFFTSLFLGSIITIPIMTIVGREVDELKELDRYLWIPLITAVLALLFKTLLEKKYK